MASKTLLLGGPYEFLPEEKQSLEPGLGKVLSGIFDGLGYSAGYLTPDEAVMIEKDGGKLPRNWVVVDKKPHTQVFEVQGTPIGVIFLPQLGPKDEGPTDAMRELVAKTADELRTRSKLVVAVSPWGAEAERRFIETAKREVDVLLGAGPGIGFAARPVADGRILWMRTFTQGKLVSGIHVLRFPEGKDFRWELRKNFEYSSIALDETVPNDPATVEKLKPFETKPAQDAGK